MTHEDKTAKADAELEIFTAELKRGTAEPMKRVLSKMIEDMNKNDDVAVMVSLGIIVTGFTAIYQEALTMSKACPLGDAPEADVTNLIKNQLRGLCKNLGFELGIMKEDGE